MLLRNRRAIMIAYLYFNVELHTNIVNYSP